MSRILLYFLLLLFNTTIFSQVPQSNLLLSIKYDNNFNILSEDSAFFEYQGGFLINDRFDNDNKASTFEADKQVIKFSEFPCFNNEMTISFWLKIESEQGMRYPIIVFSNEDEFNSGYTRHLGFEVHNRQTSFGYYDRDGGRIAYDRNKVSMDGEWHHILGTVSDLSLMKMYIDNQYIGFVEFDNNVYDGLNQLIIGGGYDGQFGHISIDDIHIYNRELERCEIEALFFETIQEVNCGLIPEETCDKQPSSTNQAISALKVYPNPAILGKIYVDGFSSNTFSILNLWGKEILSGKINDSEIQLGNTPPGVYMLKVGNSISKIIIQ